MTAQPPHPLPPDVVAELDRRQARVLAGLPPVAPVVIDVTPTGARVVTPSAPGGRRPAPRGSPRPRTPRRVRARAGPPSSPPLDPTLAAIQRFVQHGDLGRLFGDLQRVLVRAIVR